MSLSRMRAQLDRIERAIALRKELAGIEFRTIPGLPVWYRVGNDGSVWSRTVQGSTTTRLGEWRKLKTNPWKDGYRAIKYKGKVYKVHQLILAAFIGACPLGMQVRHLNGDTSDNRLENLAYGTPKENQKDRVDHGTSSRGRSNGKAKLTEDNVREIRRRAAAGEILTNIAKDFPVNKWMIGEIVKRRAWGYLSEDVN